jgi:hypothetical protein
MKVWVQQGWSEGRYEVRISQGHQSFTLGSDCKTKTDAQWYAKMFRKALKNHDEEKNNAKKLAILVLRLPVHTQWCRPADVESEEGVYDDLGKRK